MSSLTGMPVCRPPLIHLEFFDAALSARNLAPATIYPDADTKPRRKSPRMCTYKITDLTSFKMNTCAKSWWGGYSAPQSPDPSKAAKHFRITSLYKHQRQVSSNDIVAEKPGGAGGVEVPLE